MLYKTNQAHAPEALLNVLPLLSPFVRPFYAKQRGGVLSSKSGHCNSSFSFSRLVHHTNISRFWHTNIFSTSFISSLNSSNCSSVPCGVICFPMRPKPGSHIDISPICMLYFVFLNIPSDGVTPLRFPDDMSSTIATICLLFSSVCNVSL